MNTLSFKLKSEAPLLMHSSQAANPRNVYAKMLKEVSSKRKKTDEDHDEMSRIEFLAGAYHDEVIGYHLPADLIDACFYGSAKQFRLGSLWKQAVLVVEDSPLIFKDNNKEPEELFAINSYVDVRSVKIGTARVMRTRPKINDWSLSLNLFYDEDKINESEVVQIVNNAGKYVGFCDNRPRFGRFSVERV